MELNWLTPPSPFFLTLQQELKNSRHLTFLGLHCQTSGLPSMGVFRQLPVLTGIRVREKKNAPPMVDWHHRLLREKMGVTASRTIYTSSLFLPLIFLGFFSREVAPTSNRFGSSSQVNMLAASGFFSSIFATRNPAMVQVCCRRACLPISLPKRVS